VTYSVRFTREARRDLDRLDGVLLEQDVDRAAEEAIDAIEEALALLEKFPFSCRKAAGGWQGPFLRELIVPFGTTGYVLLFEIEPRHVVTVLAVRHQRESDYY
jgi:plasmid stabilization system protein ParE